MRYRRGLVAGKLAPLHPGRAGAARAVSSSELARDGAVPREIRGSLAGRVDAALALLAPG